LFLLIIHKHPATQPDCDHRSRRSHQALTAKSKTIVKQAYSKAGIVGKSLLRRNPDETAHLPDTRSRDGNTVGRHQH
jgi:hypothetical protein